MIYTSSGESIGKTTGALSDEPLNTLERKTREDDRKQRQLVPRALTRYFDAEPDEPDRLTIKQEQRDAKRDPPRKTAGTARRATTATR